MDFIDVEDASAAINCCRVCLSKVDELHDLFTDKMLEEGTTIAQILRECTSYAVEPSDNLSQQICQTCFENACFSYRFRRQADASYRYLTGITGQPQKSTILLVEQSTQTEPYLLPGNQNCYADLSSSSESRKIVARRGPRTSQSQNRQTLQNSIPNDCQLCGKQCTGLLDLREHLMTWHTFAELMRGLQCRLCENQYSRKDHLVRHLRNIHKVNRDRSNGRITIEQPQIKTMGQVIIKLNSNDNDSGVPYKEVKTEPVTPTTTVHRYWHAPEFVPSGKNTHTYKIALPKLNYSIYDDPLIGSDVTAESYEIDGVDNDIKPFISMASDEEQAATANLFASNSLGTAATITTTPDATTSANAIPQQQDEQEEQPHRANFQCSECHRSFFRKYHLQRHVLVHSKVRAYVCELCKRCFARNDHFLRHRKDSCKALRGPTRVY